MKDKMTICLWFDNQAEEAVKHYTSIFKNSIIEGLSRYGKEGFDIHHQKEGTAMTVSFTINGQSFTALNGGPLFKFTEAVSLQIFCENQDEIDYYWSRLSEGGEEGQCGWLKDKYGLSWQVIPSILPKLMSDPAKSGRVTEAFLKMKKFDIEKLKNA
jgi:predicted 3-demethylubiquinone-9 3-methyltransferase (glyoxalase superfamily)